MKETIKLGAQVVDSNEQMRVGLDEKAFAHDLAREVATPGVRPVDAIERLLLQQLTACVVNALGPRLIKPPVIRVHAGYSRNRWAVLSELAETGFRTWYPELQFVTKPADSVATINLEATGITLLPIGYGFGISRTYDFKIKALKTQTNHLLRLNHIKIEPLVFDDVRRLLATEHSVPQPYLANPDPRLWENGAETVLGRNEFVSFDHLTDGTRVFCACARAAHDVIRSSAAAVCNQYVANSWPHQIGRFLDNPVYAEGICHLCVADSAGPEAAAYRYGDAMQDFVDSYMNQLIKGRGIDKRTARAEVQQRLGLSRWIREAEMYQIIKQIFPDDPVLREASPPWLGRQRLDVFIPSRNLAIEYQGEQHYLPVSLFGGAEALERTIERDTLKKRLCEQNAVELVMVRFGEPLTVASLRQRLRRFLSGPGAYRPALTGDIR